jgi:hypothetical protein
MCKFNPKNDGRFIDPCLREQVKEFDRDLKKGNSGNLVACCCGHGKYPTSFVINFTNYGHDRIVALGYKGPNWEKEKSVSLRRRKRFYKKDEKGYYYIPELQGKGWVTVR